MTLALFLASLSGCSAQTYKIVTPNMSPVLKIGEVRTAAKIDSDYVIKRFDVIVFTEPEEVRMAAGDAPGAKIISRIIGLPGERIEVKSGEIFVNNQALELTFEVILDRRSVAATIVPENEYYVVGDNRPESLDSRQWKKKTIGRRDISARLDDIK
ncbi:MAG: signal peptidase I [Pyrinomonadaceae bacterium]